MIMFCPKCQSAYAEKLVCPKCSASQKICLTAPAVLITENVGHAAARKTSWGRLLIGVSLALAMTHILGNLAETAHMLAIKQGQGWVARAIDKLVSFHGLEIASVLLAGVLTGAAQRKGPVYGAGVGIFTSLMLHGLQFLGGDFSGASFWAPEALVLLAFGAAGGWAGCRGWPPSDTRGSWSIVSPGHVEPLQQFSAYDGPVAWMRVCMGIPIAVGGVLCANSLRELLLEISGGALVINTSFQADFVAWEISALAILVGSAFAGATRRNGLKQGLFVGMGTAIILLGVRLARPHFSPELLAVSVVAAVCLSLAGGWFGSQLLPPVWPIGHHKRQAFSSVYY